MKNSTLAAIVVLIIAVVGLGWWFYAKAPAATPADTQTQAQATGNTPTAGTDQGQPDTGVKVGVDLGGAPAAVTVTYGANGFSPSTVTVAKGGTVTFKAAAGADEMWIASDPHPTHTGYDGTNKATHCAAGYTGPKPLDQCSAGASFTFTFEKTGSFGYHNHGNAGDRGTVVVQ